MPMTWDADADARLFAAVLATSDIKINWSAVAARMGNGCTAKAVTHHITNIKKKAKSLETDDGAADAPVPSNRASNGNGAAGAKNPRKRGPKAKVKSEEKVQDSDDAGKPLAKKAKKAKTANDAGGAGASGTGAKKKAPASVTVASVKEEDDAEVKSEDDGNGETSDGEQDGGEGDSS